MLVLNWWLLPDLKNTLVEYYIHMYLMSTTCHKPLPLLNICSKFLTNVWKKRYHISIKRLISFDARAYPSFSSMRWLQEHVLAGIATPPGCDTSSTPHSLSIFSGFSDHLPVPVFTPSAWRHIYTTHIKT